MDHIPVNHQWRSFYRVLAGLWGLYVLIFGIVAVTRAHGTGFNQKGLPSVLGLRANTAFLRFIAEAAHFATAQQEARRLFRDFMTFLAAPPQLPQTQDAAFVSRP